MLLLAAVLVPVFALAQQGPPGGNPLDPNVNFSNIGRSTDYTPDDVGNLAVSLLAWFAWFIAVIAVVMGLYSGFLFITGGGDPAKLATARKIILWAIVGIAVSVLAFSIIAISRAFVGV